MALRSKKKTKTQEHTKLVKAVMDYLDLSKDIVAFKNVAGRFKSHDGLRYVTVGGNGLPDIHCVFKGMYLGFEIKVGADKLSDDQKEYIARIRKAGGAVLEVRSLDDVINLIEALKRHPWHLNVPKTYAWWQGYLAYPSKAS